MFHPELEQYHTVPCMSPEVFLPTKKTKKQLIST